MNELQNFNFKGAEVRTMLINDEPYFVGKDVAEILGYKDPKRAVTQHVDREDRKSLSIKAWGDSLPSLWNTKNDYSNKTLITESGLYSLIFDSQLPTAKEFKRWVTSEVLPAIRKHGMYADAKTVEAMLADPDTMIRTLQELKEERKGRLIAEQRVKELQPKADYCDTILASKALVTATQIAKDYGMSGAAMNKLLHNLGVQYKQSGTWLLYSKYQDKGWTQSETHPIVHKDGRPDVKMSTKWTQKGRLGLYELLKKHGVLPLIEQ